MSAEAHGEKQVMVLCRLSFFLDFTSLDSCPSPQTHSPCTLMAFLFFSSGNKSTLQEDVPDHLVSGGCLSGLGEGS